MATIKYSIGIKLILIITLCVPFISKEIYAQQAHYGFEDWQEFEIYDEPIDYETSNFQSFFVTFEPNVTQVQGPVGKAIRLENRKALLDNTVVPGLIFIGDLANFPAGGIPFSNNVPDSLILSTRFDIVPGDTGIVLLLFKRFGFPVSVNVFPIVGSSANFQRFSLPLTPSGIAPDSLVLILSSGDLDTPLEGSFMEIEDMSFSGTVHQLPNHDFELWETIKFEEPTEWASQNLLSAIFRVPSSVEKSNDATEGDFALSVTQREINKFGLQQNTGFCFLGETASGTPNFVPFSSSGFKLSFDYQFQSNVVDTAWFVMRGSKFNTQIQQTEILLTLEIPLVSTGGYKSFELEVKDLPQSIDSMILEIYPSNSFPGKSNGNLSINDGSRVLVDNIRLSELSSVSTHSDEVINIFPNPVSEFLNLENLEVGDVITVLNIKQQVLMIRHQNTDQILSLNVSDFNPGLYYLNIERGGKQIVKPFIIQK